MMWIGTRLYLPKLLLCHHMSGDKDCLCYVDKIWMDWGETHDSWQLALLALATLRL